jgi:hypothetical protein
MPIHTRQNLYRGVNAHLHSVYQSEGGWEGFHTSFITYLASAIDPQLPAGYVVDTEQSLQLREFHSDTGESFRRRPVPDLTIYDTESYREPLVNPTSAEALATLTRPVATTMQPVAEEFLTAVIIHQLDDNGRLGKPVTRFEVLSPSNKQDYGRDVYVAKRELALHSGLCLVEIDLLHETDPIPAGMPSYARRQPNAYPYNITISDPRPSIYTGLAVTHAFSVDTPLPTLTIPLSGDDSFALDFDAVYQTTYRSLSAYSIRVDYAALPERFGSYSADDQARIQMVLERARA